MSIRFVILGAPRTGSTLLVRTLNSIPGVACHGELLLHRQVRGYLDGFDPLTADAAERDDRAQRLETNRARDPAGFLRQALARPEPAVGLKIIYNDFLARRWRPAVEWLLAQDDLRVVHLLRRNALRRYVSEQVMHAGGAVHSDLGGRSANQVRVHIDPAAFRQRTAEVEAEAAASVAMLGDRPVLEAWYEDLATDIGGTVAAICAFLELPVDAGTIAPALEKVGASDLRDAVSNYEELLASELTRDYLRGSR